MDSTFTFDGGNSLNMVRQVANNLTAIQYKQTILLNQQVAKPVTITGMSKAQDVTHPSDLPNRDYSITANVLYTDGTSSNGHVAPFALGTHDWQRAAKTIVPTKPIKSVDLHVLFRYDHAGTVWFDTIRLLEGQAFTQYGYDSKKNYVTKTTNPLGYSMESLYDEAGRTRTSTDALGKVHTFDYDRLNRLVSSTLPGTQARIQNTYDIQVPDGHLTEKNLISPDGSKTISTTKYLYDRGEQLQSLTDPLGKVTKYNYDAHGNLSTVTAPTGNMINYRYDGANRVTDVLFNGKPRYQFTVDANGNKTHIHDFYMDQGREQKFDQANRLIQANSDHGTINWTYDPQGHLLKELKITPNGGTDVVQTFGYNKIDQNVLVQDGAYKYRFDYDETGSLRTVVTGNRAGSHYLYDENNQVIRQTIGTVEGKSIYSAGYTYDPNGNRKVVSYPTGKTVNYDYDELNQLTSESDPSRYSNNVFAYQYDEIGNRKVKVVKSKAGDILSATNYGYNAMNQLISINGKPLLYDNSGNLIDDGSKQYEWDSAGRLITVKKKSDGTEIASYTYDEQGRRIRSVVNGEITKYVYDGASIRVLYETDAGNQLTRRYTYHANGQLLSSTKSDGKTYFYHQNAHGDVVAVTDSSGNTVAEYVYDAWGNILEQSGSYAEENPYRYAGYRYDSETGLYYLTARYYDPTVGRFLSIDPQASDELDPLAQNLYLYTRNNPVMYVDPDGNFFVNAAFLVVDIATFVAAPTPVNAAWILADIATLADPTGMASTALHVGKTSRMLNTFAEVRKVTKGRSNVEAHHLVEKRFAKKLGVKPRHMLSVGVEKGQHQVYTNLWRERFPYGKTNYNGVSVTQLKEAVTEVYRDDEKLRDATLRWLDQFE